MLKDLRIKANLTQNQLSFLSGVSIKTISRIENGEIGIQYQIIRKLADFFETDTNQIIK